MWMTPPGRPASRRARALRAAFVVTATFSAGCNHGNEARDPDNTISANPPEPTSDPTQVATGEPEPVDAAPPPSSQLPDPPEIHRNPPAPVTGASHPNVLNPKNAARRVIKRAYQGDGCFVDGDFAKGEQPPPGKAPPQVKVDCPPELADPAYDACRGGVLQSDTSGQSCACFQTGNPPPPARRIPCPANPK